MEKKNLHGSILPLNGTGVTGHSFERLRPRLHGSGQIFSRTKTFTVPHCVYTRPSFERLSVQVWDFFFSGLRLAHLGPVYTGLGKFLHGQIFFLACLFTWIRANYVAECSGVYMDLCKF